MFHRKELDNVSGPDHCLPFYFSIILYFNAISVDPILTSRSATASGLGLHCYPMSLLWDDRHKCVNFKLGNWTHNNGKINPTLNYFTGIIPFSDLGCFPLSYCCVEIICDKEGCFGQRINEYV